MATKREIYRLDLPGNYLTNWVADEAAKTASPPMMPMDQGGLATVPVDRIREGLEKMYGGFIEDQFSESEIEEAKSKILEELEKLPDDVDEVEYITMR